MEKTNNTEFYVQICILANNVISCFWHSDISKPHSQRVDFVSEFVETVLLWFSVLDWGG